MEEEEEELFVVISSCVFNSHVAGLRNEIILRKVSGVCRLEERPDSETKSTIGLSLDLNLASKQQTIFNDDHCLLLGNPAQSMWNEEVDVRREEPRNLQINQARLAGRQK